MMSESTKRGGANAAVGLVLILLGGFFLATQFLGVNLARFTWPFFIILPGLGFFVGMVLGGKSVGGLAIPGSVITTIGLLLLYQNTFDHWESWSYAWALIPSAVGIGLIIHGTWSDLPRLVREGRRLFSIGLVMLVVGFVFFELVIGVSDLAGGMLRKLGLPALLILLGLYFLGGQFFGRTAERPSDRDEPAEGR